MTPPQLFCWCLTDAQIQNARDIGGCKPCPEEPGKFCGDPNFSDVMALYPILGRQPQDSPMPTPTQGPTPQPTPQPQPQPTQSSPQPQPTPNPSSSSPMPQNPDPNQLQTNNPSSQTTTASNPSQSSSPLPSSLDSLAAASFTSLLVSSDPPGPSPSPQNTADDSKRSPGVEPTESSSGTINATSTGTNTGTIIGCIAAGTVFVLALIVTIWLQRRIRRKLTEGKGMYTVKEGPAIQQFPASPSFPQQQLQQAHQQPVNQPIPESVTTTNMAYFKEKQYLQDFGSSDLWHSHQSSSYPHANLSDAYSQQQHQSEEKLQVPSPSESFVKPSHPKYLQDAYQGISLPFEERGGLVASPVDIKMVEMVSKKQGYRREEVLVGGESAGASAGLAVLLSLNEVSDVRALHMACSYQHYERKTPKITEASARFLQILSPSIA
ncbi:hypothetical protein HDU97_001468 [Phlyctochytrium planicorne]|nr:hypothetical protein HDU97_001468 [Phlyctochytrium planicorne]